MLADDHLDGRLFEKAAARLEEPELLELKDAYEAAVARRFGARPQLRRREEVPAEDETPFLV